jgi:hypothetical protein
MVSEDENLSDVPFHAGSAVGFFVADETRLESGCLISSTVTADAACTCMHNGDAE